MASHNSHSSEPGKDDKLPTLLHLDLEAWASVKLFDRVSRADVLVSFQPEIVIGLWLGQYTEIRLHEALEMRPQVPETIW